MRQGHHLALYCYSVPSGVPDGVEIRSAADVLPQAAVFKGRRRSFAPFSDWFRYELQQLGAGIWVDADVYLVAPLDCERHYLFGKEDQGVLNNAILRLPSDSEVLRRLLVPFREKSRPYWMDSSWRNFLASGVGSNPARLPWGMTGPVGLTAVAKDVGVYAEAYEPAVFYPIPWQKAGWIVDPSIRLDDEINDETQAVHLWNHCIASFKDKPAPKGTFLERLQIEGRD